MSMPTKERKPTLIHALAIIFIPIACILYGTVVLRIMPPVVPLVSGVILAVLLCMPLYIPWAALQQGIFDAVHRALIGIFIIILVGALIGIWMHCGTIGMIIYWGLRIISVEWFLVTAFVALSVASLMTGSSFASVGTVGVAFFGIGTAMGYSPGMIMGAILGGAMLGDKMSPISDTTNIAATTCETDLFSHIGSMMYTTIPAAVGACILFSFMGRAMDAGTMGAVNMEQVSLILNTLAQQDNLSLLALFPPAVLFGMAFKKYPVLPIMVISIFAGIVVAAMNGAGAMELVRSATSGYVSQTGVKAVDSLLSRGGMLSVLSTILLFLASVSFGGVLERSGAFDTVIKVIVNHATSRLRLISATLGVGVCILMGTGNMMLASIMTGRAFIPVYRERNIHSKVLSRTCEDSATVLSVLVPWSVPSFFFFGILGVSTLEYLPYCFFNILCPVFSIIYASTGFGIWDRQGIPLRSLFSKSHTQMSPTDV